MFAHWDDVASDLSAVHRIDDPWSMPARRLFSLAYRLPAYPGVLALRVRQESAAAPEPGPTTAAAPSAQISFDDWVSGNRDQVLQAAIRMAGGEQGGG